jgi:hypothetical protein
VTAPPRECPISTTGVFSCFPRPFSIAPLALSGPDVHNFDNDYNFSSCAVVKFAFKGGASYS